MRQSGLRMKFKILWLSGAVRYYGQNRSPTITLTIPFSFLNPHRTPGQHLRFFVLLFGCSVVLLFKKFKLAIIKRQAEKESVEEKTV